MKNMRDKIGMSEELAGSTRENQKSFLEHGLNIIRDSMALHFRKSEIVHIPGEELDFMTKFAPFVSGENVLQLEKELTRAIADIERNVNSRIIFLDLVLKISDLIKR